MLFAKLIHILLHATNGIKKGKNSVIYKTILNIQIIQML